MTVTAPPRPPRPSDPVDREEVEALVEALIEEARKRAQRRRRRNAAVVTLVALVGAAVFALLGRSAQSQTASPAVSARSSSAAQAVTSRIAFTSSYYPLPGPDELYVVNADGSEKRLLARLLAGRTRPAWSPDGQTIAVAGYRRVLFVNADGSGQRNVALEWGLDGFPVWSPDGQRIAFVRERGNDGDIYVMNADGSGLRRLTRTAGPGWNAVPIWSPNGRRIAFNRVQPPAKPRQAEPAAAPVDEMAFLKSVSDDEPARPIGRRSSNPGMPAVTTTTAPSSAPSAAAAAGGGSKAASGVAKTLKCGECGTLNRPTEWYCERCGAELAGV